MLAETRKITDITKGGDSLIRYVLDIVVPSGAITMQIVVNQRRHLEVGVERLHLIHTGNRF